MFLTNQPFQRGWETQKNRPLIKVRSQFGKFMLYSCRIDTTTKRRIMLIYGQIQHAHIQKRYKDTITCLISNSEVYFWQC
jgi:hypothetical protein